MAVRAVREARYGGGAGDATRRITVNDTIAAANHTFPGTGDWANWNTTDLTVSLNRGHNTIRVDIDPASGNGNWLNFDRLTIHKGS